MKLDNFSIRKRIFKRIWRELNWAFNNFNEFKDYANYCDCIYYSEASRYFDRESFERMMVKTMY